jgi:DNA-binding response OmpR family regulator
MHLAGETSPSQPLTVAVVDTDSGFLQVLTKRMDGLGWRHRVTGGPIAADALVSMRLDALVVDLTVLGPAAWNYLQEICERLPGLAVVVCTGRSSVAQRVRGLRMGADDWVTKPCHPEEVIARVEAVVRRSRVAAAPAHADVIDAGELSIRQDQYQAFVGSRSTELTRREFELLHLLARQQDQVLQREEIYQRVWGYAMAHGDRSVDVFVRKLRQKLEARSPGWVYIHTHFGIGYRFQPEPRDGDDTAPVAPHEAKPTPQREAAGADAVASAPAEPLDQAESDGEADPPPDEAPLAERALAASQA